MNLFSLPFLLGCAVVSAVYQLLPWKGGRQLLLSAVNLAFLASLVPNAATWVGGIAFLGVTFAVLCIVRDRPSGWVVLATIGALVAAFLYLKRYPFLERLLPAHLWQHPVELVGLSYMLFKAIHMLVDQWQGQLAPFTFGSYANYQLSFFTLLAGPIQRYNDFHQFWSEMGVRSAETGEAWASWNRLLTGMLKMGVVAPLLLTLFDYAAANLVAPRPRVLPDFAIYAYAYPVYLYFNFAGYTDTVIGAARLFGLKLPENFAHPFLARNVLDFWNRWHITLTRWIRDYVFMSSYKQAAQRFPTAARYLGYGLLFLALCLAGVWHGAAAGFAVFGAIHGIGAAVNQAYGDGLRAYLGRARFQLYQQNGLIRAMAVFVTFHFVCFSFLFFSSGVARATELLELVGHELGAKAAWTALMPVAAALAVAAALLWVGSRRAVWFDFLARWEQRQPRTQSRCTVVIAKTALVVCGIFAVWAFGQQDPVVVYMRF
jgi:alginate O-acetyltransferase complex protein AlgI